MATKEHELLRVLYGSAHVWAVDARASTTGVYGSAGLLRALDDLKAYYDRKR